MQYAVNVLFLLCLNLLFLPGCLAPIQCLAGDTPERPEKAQARLPGILSPWDEKGNPAKVFPACTLIVKVTGLDPPKGILRLALYDSRESYKTRSRPVRSVAVEITGPEVTLKFDGLSPGEYAIMMYHDANRNNRFDRFLGMPREQFGFSNNALPGLGPPGFDKVKFNLSADKVSLIEIKAR